MVDEGAFVRQKCVSKNHNNIFQQGHDFAEIFLLENGKWEIPCLRESCPKAGKRNGFGGYFGPESQKR